MPSRSQRVILTNTGKITVSDLSRSVYLRGAQAQAIEGPDLTGPGAALPGFNVILKNDSAFDSTFTPLSPHTVEGQASLSLPAGSCYELERAPGGTNYVVVASVG